MERKRKRGDRKDSARSVQVYKNEPNVQRVTDWQKQVLKCLFTFKVKFCQFYSYRIEFLLVETSQSVILNNYPQYGYLESQDLTLTN